MHLGPARLSRRCASWAPSVHDVLAALTTPARSWTLKQKPRNLEPKRPKHQQQPEHWMAGSIDSTSWEFGRTILYYIISYHIILYYITYMPLARPRVRAPLAKRQRQFAVVELQEGLPLAKSVLRAFQDSPPLPRASKGPHLRKFSLNQIGILNLI